MTTPPADVVWAAERAAQQSPCQKSKRGAAIFDPALDGWVTSGFNHPPVGFSCDGSEACRVSCGKRCLHAEHAAIRLLPRFSALKFVLGDRHGLELVHVKIGEDGKVVPGGGPSCWQCSREILDIGIAAVWLFEFGTPNVADRTEPPPTWVRYDARTFHVETCRNCEVY